MNRLPDRLNHLLTQTLNLPNDLKFFLFNVFAYSIAVEGISAVLLNLFLLRLGYGTEFIGAVNSAGLLVFALVSLPIGAVRRYSSRRMMQVGQLLSLIGLLGIPLAFYVTTGQAALLIISRVVAMVGLSTCFVHQIPLALEISKPEWHDQVLSLTMATFSLSAFSGSWIGGLLPELFGRLLALPLVDPRPYQWPMFVATAMILPAMLAIRRISVEPKGAATDTAASTTANPAPKWRRIAGLVAIILVVRALQSGGIGVTLTFANVYFDEALLVPTRRIGFVSGLGRLLGVPLSLTIPWLVRRYGNFNLVHISLGSIILLILPMALIPSWPVAASAFVTINSMGTLRYLSFLSFTLSLVSEKERSLISGANEMAIGTGFALASFVGGYLIAWFGYRELFLFGAGMTAIGAIAFWLIFRKRAASEAAEPVSMPH